MCLRGSLDSGSSAAPGETLIFGSQDHYSNEFIAEIYAQALEANDIKVHRDLDVGQREVCLPDIEAGKVDVVPRVHR